MVPPSVLARADEVNRMRRARVSILAWIGGAAAECGRSPARGAATPRGGSNPGRGTSRSHPGKQPAPSSLRRFEDGPAKRRLTVWARMSVIELPLRRRRDGNRLPTLCCRIWSRLGVDRHSFTGGQSEYGCGDGRRPRPSRFVMDQTSVDPVGTGLVRQSGAPRAGNVTGLANRWAGGEILGARRF